MLAALGLCMALSWIDPYYFLRDDNSTENLPNYVHSYRTLAESGALALVNPHQYLGIPHLASGQPAVLYPPTYVAVALASWTGDVRRAIGFLVAVHLAAGALGMWCLLRALGLGRRGGDVAGALLWLTAPFVVLLSRAWIPYAYSAAFVPWSFWLLLRLLDRRSKWWIVAYGSVKTLFFFTGHPQMLVYSTLFEGLFWLGLRGRRLWHEGRASLAESTRQAAALAAAALWTGATSAPLLLPMLETLSVSFMRRNPLPIEVFAEFPLRLGELLLAQVFVFRDEVFITAGSSIYFLGLPFLAALVTFFFSSRRGRRRVTMLAVAGLLALVAATPAWRLAYGLPLLSTFRWPAKFFLFFVFASIPAVALVYERLADRRPLWAQAALALTLGCSLAVLVVPEWRHTMGDATLDRPVAEYETHFDELCGDAGTGGRIVAFRRDGTLSASEWDALAPYLGAYNYATLFARHQLGGYEPLVSSTHFELSAGMSYTATLPVRRARPELFRHLARWGVRCVLVPDLPGIHAPFLDAGLRRAGSARVADAGVIVAYRLDAAAIVVRLARPGEDVPFRWTASGLEADLDEGGEDGEGVLRIALAPLRQWTVELADSDGEPVDADWQIDPNAGLVVRVPEGARHLEVGYREPGFEAGLWIAALALSGVLLAWILDRRRP